MSHIQKAAVLGAGLMGSQIAAQIANAGVPVLLLDIVPSDARDRNIIAKTALEKLAKAEPAAFMHKNAAKLVSIGNLDDDLSKLADCDWIIEAVVEKIEIKTALYQKIDAVRKAGSVVSSNTSTIPLHLLLQGQSDTFAADFCITHFFNPPRYMRLLEIVGGSKTRPEALKTVADFADKHLGKGVVLCRDTPGFIANRLGVFFMQAGINAAFEMGLTVEEADAVLSKPIGWPKTGVFGLTDLVGLDLMPLIAKSLLATLPQNDAYRALYQEPELIKKMLADGYTGRKGKGGFYRLNTEGGKKSKEAIDLKTGQYRPVKKAALASVDAAKQGLVALLSYPDMGGRYAFRVLSQGLVYAATIAKDIAHSLADIDEALRLGFNWKYGPFELIDAIGSEWLCAALEKENISLPPLLQAVRGKTFYRVEAGALQVFDGAGYVTVARPEGVLLLSDIKRTSKPVAKNGSASLWDIGDGVLCAEFHSKMNSLDISIFALLKQAVQIVAESKGQYKALVIYNDGEHFSAGANLGQALFALNIAATPLVEQMVVEGQNTYQLLKYAPFPVVVAPHNLALGGGCEILLHADAVQAHAELYTGLVEVGVGIVPAWGGCAQMLARAYAQNKRAGGFMPPVAQMFEQIGTAKVSKSAQEARDLLILRPQDGISMNRARQLADAKAKAISLMPDYKPPVKPEYRLPGPSGAAALALAVRGLKLIGKATPHDVVVSKALAYVLTGGKHDSTEVLTEEQILQLERESFMKLLATKESVARMEHMLETGKPLRN